MHQKTLPRLAVKLAQKSAVRVDEAISVLEVVGAKNIHKQQGDSDETYITANAHPAETVKMVRQDF